MRQASTQHTIGRLMIAIALVGGVLALLKRCVGSISEPADPAWKGMAICAGIYAAGLWAVLRTREDPAATTNRELEVFESCQSLILESRAAGARRDEEWGACLASRSSFIRDYAWFLGEASARLVSRTPAWPERPDGPGDQAP